MAIACVRVIIAAVMLNLVSESLSARTVDYCYFDEVLLCGALVKHRLGLPRVVIVKWNRSSCNYFFILLLLCGDVSINPGPPRFPCGVCHCEVADSDPTICCDFCDNWIHVSCDPKISLVEYQNMQKSPTEDSWICSACESHINALSKVGDAPTPPDCLLCVCLNARSILPKRFDLIAYLSADQFEIVAITESFLDSSIPVIQCFAVIEMDTVVVL